MPIYKGQVPSSTWATKPAASAYVGHWRFTDVGINGSLWYSNGTNWVHESPITVRQKAKGWLVPSLASANAATYSQTATTITVTSTGHTIPASTFDGYDVYLAIGSGLAASGWYSNFTRVDANTFTCVSSVSQTTSGTVNTNTAEVTVTEVTKTIAGGLLGDNGRLNIDVVTHALSNSNAKTATIYFGGTAFAANAVGTSLFSIDPRGVRIWNANNAAIQFSTSTAGYAPVNIAPVRGAVNTAIDKDVTLTLTNSAANLYIALMSINIEVTPT